MSRVVLQVPMPEDLRNEAEKAALSMGFSSLQESVRLILKKLANRELKVSIYEEGVLSPEGEARYRKVVKEIEAGKNIIKTEDVNDFFNKLRS